MDVNQKLVHVEHRVIGLPDWISSYGLAKVTDYRVFRSAFLAKATYKSCEITTNIPLPQC